MTLLLLLLTIIGPAVLLVAAMRRWFTPIPWSVALALLVVAIAFLGASVWSPSTIPVPVDEVIRGYPYAGLYGPVQPRNPLTNDTVKQLLPWMDEVRRQLFRGELPLWNPYAFSGYPLLANAQSAPFSPFFLLTLAVPLPKQLVAMAGLKIFVSLLFMYLLAVDEGASRLGALFAAIAFGFSVFQTVYLYYPLTSVTACLPAAIYAVHRCMRERDFRSWLLVVLAGAAVLAGGHPESAFHIGIASMLFLAVGFKRSQSGLPIVVIAAVTSIGLTAFVWAPALEQVLVSARAHEIAAQGRASSPPFPRETLMAILHPDAFGNPARGDWAGWGNYAMTAPSYLGLVVLVLLVMSLLRPQSRRTVSFSVIAILLFLVAMNWSPIGRLINQLPGFNSAANDRLRVFSLFFATIAAARTIGSVRRGVVFVGVIVAAAACYAGATTAAASSPVAVLPAVALLAFVAIVAANRSDRAICGAAVAACAIELFALNTPFNASANTRYYKPELPIIDRLRGAIRERPGRVVGFDWVFLPNASVHYAVEDIRGSDPMALATYTQFFQLVAAQDPHDVKRIQNANQPGLDFLGVRYLLTSPDHDPGGNWVERYRDRDGRLLENDSALPRFYPPVVVEPFDSTRPLLDQLQGIPDFRERVIADISTLTPNPPDALRHIAFDAARPTEITVRTEAKAAVFLASSQVAAPGWRLTINGRQAAIHTVNGAFIGFVVPAGTATAVLRYRPWTVSVGLAVSVASAILIALALLLRSGLQNSKRSFHA